MADHKLSPAQEKFFSRYISDTLLAQLQQDASAKPASRGYDLIDAEIRKALADAKASQPQLTAWKIPQAQTFASEAGTLATDHAALDANSDEGPRHALLDQIAGLNQRIAQAMEGHKDAHRAQLAEIEAQFRSVELAFQDIDDDTFAEGQAEPIQDYLIKVRAEINDATGYDGATLPFLRKMVTTAQALVSDVEATTNATIEIIERLRKLDLIIQQNGGSKAPLAAVFEEHRLEHADLSRRWHIMPLPDAMAAVRDLAMRVDADVHRSGVLLARRVN